MLFNNAHFSAIAFPKTPLTFYSPAGTSVRQVLVLGLSPCHLGLCPCHLAVPVILTLLLLILLAFSVSLT